MLDVKLLVRGYARVVVLAVVVAVVDALVVDPDVPTRVPDSAKAVVEHAAVAVVDADQGVLTDVKEIVKAAVVVVDPDVPVNALQVAKVDVKQDVAVVAKVDVATDAVVNHAENHVNLYVMFAPIVHQLVWMIVVVVVKATVMGNPILIFNSTIDKIIPSRNTEGIILFLFLKQTFNAI